MSCGKCVPSSGGRNHRLWGMNERDIFKEQTDFQGNGLVIWVLGPNSTSEQSRLSESQGVDGGETVPYTEIMKKVEQRDRFGGGRKKEIRSSLLATLGW